MEVALTEREIERMEHFHTPTSMIENLLPVNENAPQTWSADCDCIYLYPYQNMMQNFSYLVANDSRLDAQQNADKRKGAGDLYTIGSRNTGKCEYVENECQLSDGSVKKFGDLIGMSKEVISFNEKTLKLEQDKACFKDNGLKPCYKIILHSGKEIIVTENHPLYTNEGWIHAKNISKDMMVATPRSIDIKSDVIVDDNEAKIIGYLLGDGSCTTSNISISNINKELINEIYALGDYFDCKMRTYDDSHFFSKKTIPAIRRGANVKNNVHNIVIKYNIDKLSKEKTIYSDVFMWPNKSVAIMLNRLFACDGHVNKKDNIFEITLASEKMIQQIQTLLLRFGIHSNYNYKKAKCEEKYFDAWRLYVDADVNQLLNVIGIKSKDDVVLNDKKFETSDVLPKNLISRYRHELDKPCLLNDKRTRGFSRNKVSALCNDWYHPNLFKLSNSDIYWEWIDKIEFVGELPTVVVSVEKNHTYISNNIISHNSFLLKFDVLLTWIHKVREACVGSFNQKHLSKVTDPIAFYLESHPFAQIFHLKKGSVKSVNRKHGGLKATSEHGCLIESANEQIDDSKNIGTDFHGKHYETLWYEEASYMSKDGTEKRIDSGSSLGYIERPSGIPDLRIGSPLTKILQDKKLKRWIWRLPQMVRPDWCDAMREKRIGEYNGENSSGFKLNVLAETIEGAEGFWDIDRLKKASYNVSRKVKYFEVNKENFKSGKYKESIIVERMPGTEQVFICSDIGYSGSPSQVIVIFKVGNKYKYVYNIPLFKLLHREQAEVVKWLYDVLGTGFIATDATGDNGAIIDDLFDMGIPQEHLLKVFLGSNMEVGFETDAETGFVIKDNNGNPIMKEAKTIDWAMFELEKLMYGEEDYGMDIPQDENFLEEFGGYIVKMNGTRKTYDSFTTDHKHQSFQCFAICRFFNEFNLLKNKTREKRCYGST